MPSTNSDEYKAWKDNDKAIPTINSFYFTSKGNVFGIIPGTYIVTSIQSPFKSFDSSTRVLTSVTGERARLPIGQEEKTNMPCKIFERTKKELKRLAK